MTRRTLVASLLALAAAGGVALVLFPGLRRTTEDRPPAPPPSSEGVPLPIALSPAEREALTREVAARVKAVNLLHEQYVAGLIEREPVEEAELAMLDAQRALGEMGGAAHHRARAAVFQQRAERFGRFVMVGRVSKEDLAIAQLDAARERALAGDPSDYAAARVAVLAAGAIRRKEMVAAGRTTAGDAAAEEAALERRFPPLPGGGAPAK